MVTNLTTTTMYQILNDSEANCSIDAKITHDTAILKYTTRADIGKAPLASVAPRVNISTFLKAEDFGAPGDFKVAAPLAKGTLAHRCRNAANFTWSRIAVFGGNVALGTATLTQCFKRLLSYIRVHTDAAIQRYFYLHGTVNRQAEEKSGAGVKMPPGMMRSWIGKPGQTTPGNYELCVAINGQIQHWWTPGDAAPNWKNSATFGSNIKSVIGLTEGSDGFDLEVIAMLDDGSLQRFYRSDKWYAQPVIGANPVPQLQATA